MQSKRTSKNVDDAKKKEEDAAKEKLVKEAKSKAELENLCNKELLKRYRNS